MSVYALAVAYACGVMLAEASQPPAAVALAAGGLSATMLAGAGVVAARSRTRVAAAVAVLAALLLAVSLAGLRIESLRRSALERGAGERAEATLGGRVLEQPKAVGGSLRFTLGVDAAAIDGASFSVRERAAVFVRPEPSATPRPGDRVTVTARLAPVERSSIAANDRAARERAARDREHAARLRRGGVSARAYAAPDAIDIGGRSRSPLVVVARIGQDAMERAAAVLPARERGLLMGVTVGDDSALDPDVEADFRATGLSHLLAVSGGNLAMLLGALTVLLRRFGLRTRTFVLAVATLAFMAITRFEPSVIRAGAMTGTALLATAAGARRDAVHALGVACFALLLWDPFLIHSGGFQLSALATLGLLVIAPKLRAAFGGGRLAAAAAVSLGAQLAVAPLVALRFHETSLVALPANLLAVPAVTAPTVLGLAGAALGLVWEPLGRVCALASWPFLRWMEWVAETLAKVPHATVTTPSGAGAMLSVGASIALVAGALRMRRLRAAPVLLGVITVLGVIAWSRALQPVPPSGLRIAAIDVGQGDAVLVRSPDGATMLVDGGPKPEMLLKGLRAQKVSRIDVMVLTHPHTDHVDGLIEAVKRLPVGAAIDSGEPFADDTSPWYPAYLDELERKGVSRTIARAGMSFSLGDDVRVEVLAPQSMMEGTDSDPNNNSVVMRVRYGATCALLAAEVQEEGQDALLRSPDALSCPVFKVPHHGSGKALRQFYAATNARVALVTVGANSYGHPARKPLEWMRELRMDVLRTDQRGDVIVTIGATGGIHVI